MPTETFIEGGGWILSMALVATLSFLFSRKMKSANPETTAIPMVNAHEGSRLFFILGMNYAAVTAVSVVLFFSSNPFFVSEIESVLRSWWIVEVFIFFNLITSFCLWSALNRVIINVRNS